MVGCMQSLQCLNEYGWDCCRGWVNHLLMWLLKHLNYYYHFLIHDFKLKQKIWKIWIDKNLIFSTLRSISFIFFPWEGKWTLQWGVRTDGSRQGWREPSGTLSPGLPPTFSTRLAPVQVDILDPSEDTQKLVTKTALTFWSVMKVDYAIILLKIKKLSIIVILLANIISIYSVNVNGNQMFLWNWFMYCCIIWIMIKT